MASQTDPAWEAIVEAEANPGTCAAPGSAEARREGALAGVAGVELLLAASGRQVIELVLTRCNHYDDERGQGGEENQQLAVSQRGLPSLRPAPHR